MVEANHLQATARSKSLAQYAPGNTGWGCRDNHPATLGYLQLFLRAEVPSILSVILGTVLPKVKAKTRGFVTM